VVRQVDAGEWEALRDLRLRALADAPSAFASTWEDERAAPESMWRERAERAATGLQGTQVVAELDGVLCATATGYVDADGQAWLVAMWVAPEARGRGLGRVLVQRVAEWARERGDAALRLWVTETNPAAVRLYESCGFVPVGPREPIRDSGSEIVALYERRL
jgi:GNAT superfamily N-acetyltransferase